MGRKKVPGLICRNGIWHIDKQVRGQRVCQSTGESDLERAEEYLARKIEEIRLASIYGVRPQRTFRQAATKHLNESTKASLKDDAIHLKILDPFIGDLALDRVNLFTLQTFIQARRRDGVKTATINHGLQVVRHILNMAAGEWVDENGMTWLASAPKIKFLPVRDVRPPYPLSPEEQEVLFQELPKHLRAMALFKVNTGTRQGEVCSLQWDWEVPVPELDTRVFIIPAHKVKNRSERLVVLNDAARSVVEAQRGIHPRYVFAYKGRRIQKILDSAWRNARKRAGLPQVRVHDLKHTFGRRLRAAGVPFEDRQDLLGHKSGRMTTHYSQAELGRLMEMANRVCQGNSRKSPALVVLKRRVEEVAC